MRKSRFAESQIVRILKEADAGMKISQFKCMKDIEAELPPPLKCMYADLVVCNRAIKNLTRKNSEAA